MIDRTALPTDLQALLKRLEADLLERSESTDYSSPRSIFRGTEFQFGNQMKPKLDLAVVPARSMGRCVKGIGRSNHQRPHRPANREHRLRIRC
jgi:hypothetical protein